MLSSLHTSHFSNSTRDWNTPHMAHFIPHNPQPDEHSYCVQTGGRGPASPVFRADPQPPDCHWLQDATAAPSVSRRNGSLTPDSTPRRQPPWNRASPDSSPSTPTASSAFILCFPQNYSLSVPHASLATTLRLILGIRLGLKPPK